MAKEIPWLLYFPVEKERDFRVFFFSKNAVQKVANHLLL